MWLVRVAAIALAAVAVGAQTNTTNNQTAPVCKSSDAKSYFLRSGNRVTSKPFVDILPQFPNSTYPNAISTNPTTENGTQSFQQSPPFYPSPWGSGTGDWAGAYSKARAFVSQLTLLEKVNLTTGVG